MKNSWIMILLAKPKLYLFTLLKQTFIIGVCLSLLYSLARYFGMNEQYVPSSIHGLTGFVIGMLLVFRTSTAYERWWEARKLFSSLQSSIIYLKSFVSGNPEINRMLSLLNSSFFEMISNESNDSLIGYKKTLRQIIHGLRNEYSKVEVHASGIDRKFSEIIDIFCSLERIKTTPIPFSYSFHIKISIFAYILSLPFGMFYSMGAWSILLTMLLFFIIAGIEIISNEIENPFRGDPNDLPIDSYEQENNMLINHENK